jgi:nucleoid DNA-binding protein
MKKTDLAGRLAQRRHITKAEAADQLDGVVHRILRKLRSGKPATLPGLGTISPGRKPKLTTTNKPPRGTGRKRGSL